MPKKEILTRLHETIESELAAIAEYQDELLDGVDEDEKGGLRAFIGELVSSSSDRVYYPFTQKPTPQTNLAARALFGLKHESASHLHPLLRFLEDRDGPFVAQPDPPPYEINLEVGTAVACPVADSALYDALKQVRRQRDHGQRIVSAYHDDGGRPLMFRKSDFEPTALTLAPIRTQGVVIPPGTIVGVAKGFSSERTGRQEHRGYAFESWRLTEDDAIDPLRLSAWAYADPVDRSMFACAGIVSLQDDRSSRIHYDRYRGEMFRRISLEDFAGAAQKIIEFCAD